MLELRLTQWFCLTVRFPSLSWRDIRMLRLRVIWQQFLNSLTNWDLQFGQLELSFCLNRPHYLVVHWRQRRLVKRQSQFSSRRQSIGYWECTWSFWGPAREHWRGEQQFIEWPLDHPRAIWHDLTWPSLRFCSIFWDSRPAHPFLWLARFFGRIGASSTAAA